MSRFHTIAFIVALILSPLLGCGSDTPQEDPSSPGADDSDTAIVVDDSGLYNTGTFARVNSEKGGEEPYLSGPYEPVPNWPQPLPDHEDWVWGATTGIVAESPNRIIVAQRGELPRPDGVEPGWSAIASSPGQRAIGNNRFEHCIYVVDASGQIVESWTQWDSIFEGGRGPHKLAISPYDSEKHVWIIDDLLHQVFKFTNDGSELILTLGERLESGNDETHFNRPTDIAFLPDGTFFVSDGYTNTRVVKFDGDGGFVMSWGTPGTGPGEFDLPHGIAADASGRVYVADRSNRRIQVFSENGDHLDSWPNINSPFDIAVSADGYLWVADGETNKMLKYDLNGQLIYAFGTYGLLPGLNWGIHQFSSDAEGNLYWAETFTGRAQKLRPREGADQTHLVQPFTGS